MKKQKSIGNKGFSLVELIIVIAIMAILIGVMAPNLLRYVEKSRVSADTQVADTVRTAIMTAMLDPEVDSATIPTTADYTDINQIDDTTAAGSFDALVKEILGDEPANIKNQLKSKGYKGQPILYKIDGSKVLIRINPVADSGAPVLDIPASAPSPSPES